MSYSEFITQLNNQSLQRNYPLSDLTTFKIGGPADLYLPVNTQTELIQAVKLAKKLRIRFTVLGGGSNILVADAGYRGLIIHNQTHQIHSRNHGTAIFLTADSGVRINQLVQASLDQGLAGLEPFIAVPGTVGGAIYNNSHYAGFYIGDLVSRVKLINHRREVVTVTGKEMAFAYDYSILHQTKDIVLSVTFRLKKGNKAQLWQEARAAAIKRAKTQPLSAFCSGCIFQNPSPQELKAAGLPSELGHSGKLIDLAGLKGTKIGGAEVSTKHAAFIINSGGASAKDVKKLIGLIKKTIKTKYHLNLKEEIIYIG